MEAVVFCGGGTGGHIYPGLALIERLQEKHPYRIVWLGSRASLDRSIVERAGVEFIAIPSGKLRRYFSFKNFTDIFRIISGFFVARKILKKIKPRFLFSKGGFVSVPPCVAAWSLKIPVFTHESDFSPGLATRLNAFFATRSRDGLESAVFVAYEETKQYFKKSPAKRIIISGNPIRSALDRADPARGRDFLGITKKANILLVLGGSQGAEEVNNALIPCIEELSKSWFIVHQTGANAKNIPRASERYWPFTYLHEELPDILAAASLVIGRAGAGTIWEAAHLGKPLVLIPLAGAGTRGDQIENARWFEAKGAAINLFGAKDYSLALKETLKN